MFRTSLVKKAAVMSIAAATLVALAGCSSPAESTDQTLTFVTYTGGDAGQKYTDLIASFEEANPGVTVDVEVLPGDDTYNSVVNSRLQGGTSPDIFEVLNSVPGLKPYVDAGLVTDLSDEDWVEGQVDAVKDASTFFDGKTYASISQLDGAGVLYNVDLFEANGVAVPTNWDEFQEAIAAFKAAGVIPLATGAADGWPLGVQALSMAAELPDFSIDSSTAAGLADGSVKFSDSGWVNVVQDFESLVKNGSYDPNASGIAWPASAEDFAAGKAAMLIQGTFAISAVRAANPDLDMSMFVLPYVGAGETPVASVSYGSILAIPTDAPNADLAKKFLDYLHQDDVLTTFLTTASAFSPMVGVSGELDPAAAAFAPAVEEKAAEYNLVSGLVPATQAALVSGLQAIIAGSGTAADAISALDRAQADQ